MGKKEIDELTATADLLAEMIAYLIKHKDRIQQVYNKVNKNRNHKGLDKNKYESGYDYQSKEEIESAFHKLKHEKDAMSILVEAYPLLVGTDHLIGKCLRKCVENSSIRIGKNHYLKFENGINSSKSQSTTNLMIFPRCIAMWEGSGEDREVESDSFNVFLKYARYMDMSGEYSKKKYKINCYFLGRLKAAHPDVYAIGKNSLKIGMSPMSCDYKLQNKNCKKGDLFLPKPWNRMDKEKIKSTVIDVIKKAEKEHVNLLVFPEMLGYIGLKEEICSFVRSNNHIYLKLIVLPSVWTICDDKGTNTSCLIQTYDGIEVFSQGKLIAYNDKNTDRAEALTPDDTINLLYDDAHGCMGIMICRSALETKVRNMIVDELGVKLLIIPSWSSKSHSFERMMLSVADMNCNIIWVNTCSAIENIDNKKEYKEPICMATQICKVRNMEVPNYKRFIPMNNCNKECINGGVCLFTADIEGVVRNE